MDEHESIVSRLLAALGERARASAVEDVRIGLGYTAALLSCGRLGVSYTHLRNPAAGCTVFRGLRPLAGRPASEVLPLLASSDPVEAGVGLACANALIEPPEGLRDGDILDHLDLRSGDRVAMVGRFGPLLGPLGERAGRLDVFEEKPGSDVRPAAEAEAALPGCQVALLTSTSLTNGTAGRLLAAAAGCREVVMLGPSTPLVPAVFAGTAVTLLSGVVVRDAGAVLRVVSEGGGMRLFKPHVRKVVLDLRGGADR